VFSQVDRDIEYFACNDPHQLSLRLPDLIVQPAQHVLCRARMVVLDEARLQAGRFFEHALVEAFEEESAFIAEHLGRQDQNVRYLGSDDVHQNTLSLSSRARY
jgi:hypothetical protein